MDKNYTYLKNMISGRKQQVLETMLIIHFVYWRPATRDFVWSELSYIVWGEMLKFNFIWYWNSKDREDIILKLVDTKFWNCIWKKLLRDVFEEEVRGKKKTPYGVTLWQNWFMSGSLV